MKAHSESFIKLLKRTKKFLPRRTTRGRRAGLADPCQQDVVKPWSDPVLAHQVPAENLKLQRDIFPRLTVFELRKSYESQLRKKKWIMRSLWKWKENFDFQNKCRSDDFDLFKVTSLNSPTQTHKFWAKVLTQKYWTRNSGPECASKVTEPGTKMLRIIPENQLAEVTKWTWPQGQFKSRLATEFIHWLWRV